MSSQKAKFRWESLLFGLVLGVAATVAAEAVYHQVTGMVRLSVWKRAVTQSQHERMTKLLEQLVATSDAGMKDGMPTATTEFLAKSFLTRLYEHQMAYATWLLKSGEVEAFNRLRQTTPFLLYNLSGADLKNQILTGVDFSYADLSHSDLSGCDLTGAFLTGGDLQGAALIGAKLEGASMYQSDLSNALLNAVTGGDADFREAVLVNASLTSVKELPRARFDGAVLADANLWDSVFENAVFDHADLTMASAVDCDLAQVESMANATLTGANLAGTRLAPTRSPRAWLVNAEGIDRRMQRELRAQGAIFKPEEVLDQIDRRIVAGFEAQIEEDSNVAPDQRRRVLISMLQDYYHLN